MLGTRFILLLQKLGCCDVLLISGYPFIKIEIEVQRLVQNSNFCLILILESHNIKNKDDLYYENTIQGNAMYQSRPFPFT